MSSPEDTKTPSKTPSATVVNPPPGPYTRKRTFKLTVQPVVFETTEEEEESHVPPIVVPPPAAPCGCHGKKGGALDGLLSILMNPEALKAVISNIMGQASSTGQEAPWTPPPTANDPAGES